MKLLFGDPFNPTFFCCHILCHVEVFGRQDFYFFSTISLLLLAVFLGIPFAESEFPVLDLLREKGD